MTTQSKRKTLWKSSKTKTFHILVQGKTNTLNNVFFCFCCANTSQRPIIIIIATSIYFGGGTPQTNIWVYPQAHHRSSGRPSRIKSFALNGTLTRDEVKRSEVLQVGDATNKSSVFSCQFEKKKKQVKKCC